MNFYNYETDIALKNNDFDFTETEDGLDLNLTSEEDYLRQQIKIRLGGVKPDWNYDDIGANLEELLGGPNTIDIAKAGVEKIRNELTKDGLVNNEDLYIKPSPTGENQIDYVIYIKTEKSVMSFIIELELTSKINVLEVN